MKANSSAIGFERRQLAHMLKEQAVARHPHSISFKFGLLCSGADLERGSVTFRSQGATSGSSSELVSQRFDFLVGADGQNSRVRDLLEDQVCLRAFG